MRKNIQNCPGAVPAAYKLCCRAVTNLFIILGSFRYQIHEYYHGKNLFWKVDVNRFCFSLKLFLNTICGETAAPTSLDYFQNCQRDWRLKDEQKPCTTSGTVSKCHFNDLPMLLFLFSEQNIFLLSHQAPVRLYDTFQKSVPSEKNCIHFQFMCFLF